MRYTGTPSIERYTGIRAGIQVYRYTDRMWVYRHFGIQVKNRYTGIQVYRSIQVYRIMPSSEGGLYWMYWAVLDTMLVMYWTVVARCTGLYLQWCTGILAVVYWCTCSDVLVYWCTGSDVLVYWHSVFVFRALPSTLAVGLPCEAHA